MKPVWLEIAEKEIGVIEIEGNKNNPRVIEYHQTTTLKAKEDSVPWCSSFVNWCITQAGIQGTNKANARSWLSWGKSIKEKPEIGCVVVFSRGSNPASGHVAFFLRETEKYVEVLGGNQGDCVCVSKFSKSTLLDYRYPV